MSTEELTKELSWEKLDAKLSEAGTMLNQAAEALEFRGIGTRCFNILLDLARLAYDPEIHAQGEDEDEEEPTNMDPRRAEVNGKLKPVIRYLYQGSKQKDPRTYVLRAMKHALKLHQKKADTYSEAAQCLVSTTAVVRMVAIEHGRRLD